jgi:hypothetical protein
MQRQGTQRYLKPLPPNSSPAKASSSDETRNLEYQNLHPALRPATLMKCSFMFVTVQTIGNITCDHEFPERFPLIWSTNHASEITNSHHPGCGAYCRDLF